MMVRLVDIDFAQECNLDKKRPLVVGVSGGIDSLVLLHLLDKSGFKVIVGHFNHHLRVDADSDAEFVAETARQMGYEFAGGEGDVAALAAAEKLSIEAAARKARYQFLFDLAKRNKAQAVAVGHNADDQVETLLLHLLRGSGLNGIAGMRKRSYLKQYSRDIPLVRPLLNIWRMDLEKYCHDAGLSPRYDTTNADIGYTRNRIRQELIPILMEYNPQIKERLHGLTLAAGSSLEILSDSVDLHYQKTLRSAGERFRGFDLQSLAELSDGMRVEIIRRAVSELIPHSEDVDQAAYKRAADLVSRSKQTSRTDLADGLIAFTDVDRFYISFKSSHIRDARYPQLQTNHTLQLTIPGRVMLDQDWALSASWYEGTAPLNPEAVKGDLSNVIIDADAVQTPLTVRKRLKGDQFQPLGLSHGSMTVGDFFTNSKLPVSMRADWPLVLSGDTIVWVAGRQIADGVKINKTSRRFVHLRLEKLVNNE